MADLCFGISSVHSDDESDHLKMVGVVPLPVYYRFFVWCHTIHREEEKIVPLNTVQQCTRPLDEGMKVDEANTNSIKYGTIIKYDKH